MTELAFQISISLNWNRRICPSKQFSTTQFDLQYCTSHKCLGQVTALSDKEEKLQYINSHLYMAYKILKGKHICKNALIKYSSKYTSQPQNACPKMESSPALAWEGDLGFVELERRNVPLLGSIHQKGHIMLPLPTFQNTMGHVEKILMSNDTARGTP